MSVLADGEDTCIHTGAGHVNLHLDECEEMVDLLVQHTLTANHTQEVQEGWIGCWNRVEDILDT